MTAQGQDHPTSEHLAKLIAKGEVAPPKVLAFFLGQSRHSSATRRPRTGSPRDGVEIESLSRAALESGSPSD
jgi:hypothetical protein